MKVRNPRAQAKVSLNMTAMIDIVFLLLVFFIMTFRIVALEGDFEIDMPAKSGPDPVPSLLPLSLELHADRDGELTSIRLNERGFGRDMSRLHDFIVSYVDDDQTRREQTELEIKADYGLKYEYVVAALTAVRGQRQANGRIKDLITNIKFAPPETDPTRG